MEGRLLANGQEDLLQEDGEEMVIKTEGDLPLQEEDRDVLVLVPDLEIEAPKGEAEDLVPDPVRQKEIGRSHAGLEVDQEVNLQRRTRKKKRKKKQRILLPSKIHLQNHQNKIAINERVFDSD